MQYPLLLSNNFNYAYSNASFFLLLVGQISWYQFICSLSLVPQFLSFGFLQTFSESWLCAHVCICDSFLAAGESLPPGVVRETWNACWNPEYQSLYSSTNVLRHGPSLLSKGPPTAFVACCACLDRGEKGRSWRHFSCQVRLLLWTPAALLILRSGLEACCSPAAPPSFAAMLFCRHFLILSDFICLSFLCDSL